MKIFISTVLKLLFQWLIMLLFHFVSFWCNSSIPHKLWIVHGKICIFILICNRGRLPLPEPMIHYNFVCINTIHIELLHKISSPLLLIFWKAPCLHCSSAISRFKSTTFVYQDVMSYGYGQMPLAMKQLTHLFGLVMTSSPGVYVQTKRFNIRIDDGLSLIFRLISRGIWIILHIGSCSAQWGLH